MDFDPVADIGWFRLLVLLSASNDSGASFSGDERIEAYQLTRWGLLTERCPDPIEWPKHIVWNITDEGRKILDVRRPGWKSWPR